MLAKAKDQGVGKYWTLATRHVELLVHLSSYVHRYLIGKQLYIAYIYVDLKFRYIFCQFYDFFELKTLKTD